MSLCITCFSSNVASATLFIPIVAELVSHISLSSYFFSKLEISLHSEVLCYSDGKVVCFPVRIEWFSTSQSHAKLLLLLWTPAQRKRASMLYFANVFIFFFMAALFSGPG